MWTTILGLAAAAIGLITKFVGGGSAPTAGDQKAADEAVTVDAMKRMDQAAAKPVDVVGELKRGSF